MVFSHRLRLAGPALGFGFLLALGSSIGQTYFISLFAGELQADLGLSHGTFGGLYTLATVASAILLVWLGKLADHFDLVLLSALTLAILAGCALLVAGIESVLWLGIALFGLRLGGQGMLSHLAMTAMGRWFNQQRGRALSIAMLGFPAGEALLPGLVAGLLGVLTWRGVWQGMALTMFLVLLPIALWLGREIYKRGLNRSAPLPAKEDKSTMAWTRRQVLRDSRFYVLLPGILAPPFIITGVLFHQVHLVAVKGWTLASFAACYPLYAASSTALALTLGGLIDRYGTPRILPFYLLPLAVGLALLGMSDALWVAPVFMALLGCTAGSATLVLGALWAELYGTTHLGAIRGLVAALLVLATALAPGTMGWLIDRGVSLDLQFRLMSAYSLGCALGFGLLLPRLGRRNPQPALIP